MKKQSNDQENNQKEHNEQLEEDSEQEMYDKLRTKSLPALIMLTGGAVAAVVTFVRGFTLREMLLIVLFCLIGFYILGLVLKSVFDSFRIRKKEEDSVSEEGEVIEKEPEDGNVGESAGKSR